MKQEYGYGNRSGYIVTEECLRIRAQRIEQQRKLGHLSAYTAVECTAFTFSRQEPADRWTTRIGGLPAWRSDIRWPICTSCREPLTFVAQLDFRSSCLASFVPADLLVFHYCLSCRPGTKCGSAQLTWRRQQLSPLVEEATVPVEIEGDEPGPCYGTPHVALDYDSPKLSGHTSVLKVWGTKIGGYPLEIQPVVLRRVVARLEKAEFLSAGGRCFACIVGGIR